ncbi:MAG: T9SS C-terminal target domain-containing protein [Cytophagales bacterium]|nr:MAG: T9SS C-terminal target domain-containing protein [Cytophagales bacterium]
MKNLTILAFLLPIALFQQQTTQAQEIKKENKVVIIKNGEKLVDETFNGELPEHVKKDLEEKGIQFSFEEKEGKMTFNLDEEELKDLKKIDTQKGNVHVFIRKGDEDNVKVFNELPEHVKKDLEEKGIHFSFEEKDGKMTFNLDEEELKNLSGDEIKVFKWESNKDSASEKTIRIIIRNDEVKTEQNNTNISTEQPFTQNLSIYPNPNDGSFKLSFQTQKKGDVWIEIADLQGNKVYEETIEDFAGSYEGTIQINKANKGLHVLKISQNGKVVSQEIIVN